MGLALAVGSIVLIDLSRLGLHDGNRKSLNAAAWIGLAWMLVTGLALFLTNVPRYVHNSGFWLKLGFLALALLAHCSIHRKDSRFSASLSLTLWSCVVVSSKFIADLDL